MCPPVATKPFARVGGSDELPRPSGARDRVMSGVSQRLDFRGAQFRELLARDRHGPLIIPVLVVLKFSVAIT